MTRKPFTLTVRYWSILRHPVPFGDAMTAPHYALGTPQSELTLNYSTQTGYNRHVLAVMRDIRRRQHPILRVQKYMNGSTLHVYSDAYGLLGVVIPPMNAHLTETAAV
jgi:hypothetical protein